MIKITYSFIIKNKILIQKFFIMKKIYYNKFIVNEENILDIGNLFNKTIIIM